MNPHVNVFVDSDVVVSSLLSQKGAARLLINKKSLVRYISNISYRELTIVAKKLSIGENALKKLIKNNFTIIQLKEKISTVKQKYADYTTDPNDTHIVYGAVTAKTRFLISYNIKHFKVDKIKQDFDIILYQPAIFLQYLRNR